MSILSTSPVNTRTFDAQIAAALSDFNAAVIIQQLHYWMQKPEVGTIVDNVKYIYNTFVDWVNQQFPWLSVWQFRKAMSLLRSLGIVKVIRYKAKEWNQTNYYTLDYNRLSKFLQSKSATTTENSEMCNSSPQDKNNLSIEVSDSAVSYIETKSTIEKEQQSKTPQHSQKEILKTSKMPAATSSGMKKEKLGSAKPKQKRAESSASFVEEKENVSSTKQNVDENKSSTVVEQSFNNNWRQQIQQGSSANAICQKQVLLKNLDSVGIPINKTLINLIKNHQPEEVESAIALFKTRKREHHIPNPAGYFVSVLKGNWASEIALTDNLSDVDEASIFRYWYDLARQLGYCSGFEIKDQEQWVCLSGSWEKWKDAIARGYSLDYLKKTIKRSGR